MDFSKKGPNVPEVECVPRLGITFRLVSSEPVIYCSDIRIAFPMRRIKTRRVHTALHAYIPNSDTKRPARISQLCHGSCEPCHTFPSIISARSMEKKSTWHTLVNVSKCFICCRFAMSTVWGTTVVEDVGMGPNDLWKHIFVYIPGREVSLAEITCFIGVIQVEIQGFCNLIVCEYRCDEEE